MAQHLGHQVEEVDIPIDELARDIEKGDCSEVFACGTAVIVASVESLRDGEKVYSLRGHSSIARKLQEHLLKLQQGIIEDPFGWREKV